MEQKVSWSDLFIPDFESGTLTWRSRPRDHFASEHGFKVFNTRSANTIAGCDGPNGYRVVVVNKKSHRVHRILWIMAHGDIPSDIQVDHIDGQKSNNALVNLRLATNAQNVRNTSKRTTNTSGYKGVSWHGKTGKWQAAIMVNKRAIYLGLFSDPAAASVAYIGAATKYHKEFARY